jgi:hypothetical protein
VIVGLLLLLVMPSVALGEGTPAPKTVLVLFEETRVLPAVAETDDAIRSTLNAGSTLPIRLYTEYLGLSWFPEEVRELALRDLLQKTYAARRPDVVVVWGTGGLRFVLKHRAALFEGGPGCLLRGRPGPAAPARCGFGGHGGLPTHRLDVVARPDPAPAPRDPRGRHRHG